MKKKTATRKKPANKKKETNHKNLTIKKSIEINATPNAVWKAITTPEMTRKYFFNTNVVSDWHKGDTIQYTDSGGQIVAHGEIKSIEPGKYLELKVDIPVKNGVQHTTVKYNLKRLNKGTLLSITDGDFGRIEGGTVKYRETSKSWSQALEGMKEVLEN